MTSLALALLLAAVPTVTVSGQVVAADGSGARGGTITCRLTVPGTAMDGTSRRRVAPEARATISATGDVVLPLIPNDVISPPGTQYRCTYDVSLAGGRRTVWSEAWQPLSYPEAQDIGSMAVPTYGLGSTMPAAAPSFSMSSGTASPSGSLSIFANTPDSIIYYSTNGSTPTTSSSIYTTPIPLSVWSDETRTIKAMAVPLYGWRPSAVSTITLSVPWYSALNTPGCYPSGTVWGDASWTVTRASTQTRSSGAITCAANELAVDAEGVAIYKAGTQVYPTPTAPAPGTATASSTGSWTFTVWGTGSQTISLNGATGTGFPCTATQSSPCTVIISVAGGVSWGAVTGTLTQAQFETGTYPTPFMPTVGATRSATLMQTTLPTMGANWCIIPKGRVTGRPWYVSGLIETLWMAGTISTANSANVSQNGASLIFTVNDASNAIKQVTWTTAGVAGSAKVIAACNQGGTLSLWADGVSVGTVSGAGTGTWSVQPTVLYVGSTSSSIRQWEGHVSQLSICRNVTDVSECITPASGIAVAALGDSITMGSGISAPYPTVVQSLIGSSYLVSNFGVGGYTSGQVLSLWTSTVRPLRPARVLLMAGVNDVRTGISAATAWAAIQQIITEAVADGAVVSLGTVTPFFGRAEWTAGREAERQTLNASIRAQAGLSSSVRVFDADLAVRDPADVTRILPAYDQGDHIHPNQAGANLIAAAAAATFP